MECFLFLMVSKAKLSSNNIPNSPDASLVQCLDGQPTGGTDFSSLFDTAYNFLNENLDKYNQHILCMMTDGEAPYPDVEITKFKQNQKLMDKVKVTTILYSNEGVGSTAYKVLDQIAINLNGKMRNALTAQDLENSFKELVANIYC
eukprot:403345726